MAFDEAAEAVAGKWINDRGALEPLGPERLREIKALVAQLPTQAGSENFYPLWARWFFADRSSRAVAPLSSVTVPDEVNELRSSADGSVHPRPFVKRDGKWEDVSASHRLRNGDIEIGIDERAALDLAVKPLRLVLEPPLLEVWVEVSLDRPLNPSEEQVWLAWLKAQFDTFRAPRTITWADLVATLPPGSAGAVTAFTLKHEPGGEAKSLHGDGDSDQIDQRERLLVGQIDYPGKNHG